MNGVDFSQNTTEVNKPINSINLTSLIDVTLVVLIIFILIAPMIDNGIDVDLPVASKQMAKNEETITISIAKNNIVYLDNANISILKLQQRLTQIKAANPKITIVLKADQLIPYKNIIAVLDMIKTAKIDNVSLAVKGQ